MDTATLTASPSSLDELDLCERKYENHRIKKLPDPSGPGALRGTIVHGVIEDVSRRWLAEGPFDITPKVLLEYLTKRLEAAVDAGKPVPTAVISEAKAALKRTAKWLDLRDLLLVEEPWEIDLGPEGKARGIIDRVDLPMERTDAGDLINPVVIVIDYKTGLEIVTREDLQLRQQTLLYSAAARERWPDRVPLVRYVYVDKGLAITFRWSPELDELAREGARLGLRRLAKLRSQSEPWPARTGADCVRCPYRHICPEHEAAVREDPVFAEILGMTPDELVMESRRLKGLMDLAEARRKEVNEVLAPKVQGGPIDVNGLRARWITKAQRRWPSVESTTRVISLVTGEEEETIAQEICVVQAKKLDAYLADHVDPSEREAVDKAVEATAEHGASAYVEVRKVKSVF